MRTFRALAAAALALIIAGCATSPTAVDVPLQDLPVQIRVSDRYRQEEVRSYRVYSSSIREHCIALISLESGTTMPMLCKELPNGVKPIPQSVFMEQGKSEWFLMGEPATRHSHALMRLELALVDGRLQLGGRNLRLLKVQPPLVPAR